MTQYYEVQQIVDKLFVFTFLRPLFNKIFQYLIVFLEMSDDNILVYDLSLPVKVSIKELKAI